nr:MAG TPA: hypothetical protein [Caudoviricetes sp.]
MLQGYFDTQLNYCFICVYKSTSFPLYATT